MKEEFSKDLANILTKYGAVIYWECSPGSDTHGIIGEKMVICFNNGAPSIEIPGDMISPGELLEEEDR